LIYLFPYIIVSITVSYLIYSHIINTNYDTLKVKHYKYYNCSKKLNLFFAYIIYILFSVLRVIQYGYGGTDANAYKLHFMSADKNLFKFLNENFFEYGFGTIVWITRLFSSNYKVMLLIWHSISFLLIVCFLKKFKKHNISFFSLLIVTFELFLQFNTLRQSISIALCLFMLALIYENKYIRATLVFIIACSIHLSSIILLPLLVLNWLRKRVKLEQQTIVIAGFSAFFIISSIFAKEILLKYIRQSEKYYVYVTTESNSLPIATLLIFITVFILSLIKYRCLIKNEINAVLIWSLPTFFIAIIMQSFIPIFYRTVLFFTPIFIMLISEIIVILKNENKTNKKTGKLVNFTIGLVLYTMLIYRIIYFYLISLKDIGIPYLI